MASKPLDINAVACPTCQAAPAVMCVGGTWHYARIELARML